jgi:glycosyltransferase involved in cell wall biosynthesis
MLRSMQVAARRTAKQHSWQRMAEQYLEIFHEMMDQPRGGD